MQMRFHFQIFLNRIFSENRNLRHIYMNLTIETFATSMIGVFIPIYFIRLGYGIEIPLLFLAVYFAALGFLSPLVAHLASQIGLRRAVVFRVPAMVLYLWFLMIAGTWVSVLPLLAILGGMTAAFYWIPINTEFVKNTNSLRSGRETGKMMALPQIATLFAPLMGALVLASFDFSLLFMLVIALVVLSVVPLARGADIKSRFDFKFSDFGRIKDRALSIGLVAEGLTAFGEGIMWPLYIFVAMGSFITVGVAVLATGIGAAIFMMFIGKLSDKTSRKRLLSIGAVAYASVWLMRIFADSLPEMLMLSFLGGLFMTLIRVPFFSYFSDLSRADALRMVSVREVMLSLGRVPFPILIAALFLGFETGFEISFALSSLAALGFLWFGYEKSK